MNKIIAILISAFRAGQTWAATVINVYPTNITTTSAYFQATITTNGGGSTGTVFYGFSDQTTNASSWSWSNDYGNITTTGTVSKQITALQQAQKYFYRWRILEGSAYTWAAGTSNFWTKAASPTSTPTPASISVQANPTTAALMAPTNFFNANTGLLDTALSGLFATDADVAAEASRAIAVEQQLGASVTNLNTATNSLNTRAGALETSTQTLDTAVATLNTATGSLNTAVGDLTTATGSLNTAVADLNTSTGALDSAVGALNTSTGTLNTAVGDLQTSTGALNTAVGALKVSTNALDTRVAALEGGGSAAGWSGFAATQEVFWSYETSVTTNIRVTGSSLTPAVQGDYLYAGAHNGTNYWSSTNGAFIYVNASIELDPALWVWYLYTVLEDTPGSDAYFYRSDDPPTGDYVAGPTASGIPSATYFYTTNFYNWKSGPDPDDGQAWKLTLGGTNIYRAYGTSNVFDKVIYGDGGGLTNLTAPTATNSDALGGQAAAIWVAATGSLNTAVATLNTATGSLNTAVATLNTATNALNTRADALETSTSTLNTAVADLQISTGTLNSAVGNLNTATGSLNSAVGTLNTATNSLNTRVTDLEGGGDAAGWSGFAATQEVFWSYEVSVTTNIRVTGSGLDPAVQGDYLYAGQRHSTNYWACTNGNYIYVSEDISLGPEMWCWYLYKALEDTPGDDSYFARADDPPIGDYIGGPATTGTPTAVYFYSTNTTTWTTGPDPATPGVWSVSQDGTNRYTIYPASNVFSGILYGNGAGITAVNATNAVTLAGLPASDYAKQADYAATSNDVDAVESLAAGLNSVSSLVDRVVTADYPATSNLVDSVKAVADGLNSESNNWHVAFTSVFHGAGSTGRVTSEAGDAAKYLKGDGTWSDTPAASYGTTDSTGYRGDWGGVLSNRIDALITSTQTLNTATNSLQTQININMPVGVILAYGASNAPTGWLLCDGAAVSRSTYAALFAVVGTTYGAGDASTTFNLPNLVERFPLGHTNLLGVASGVSSVTLTTDQMPAHTHTAYGGNSFIDTRGSDGTHDRPASGSIATLDPTTASAGGGLAHTNMPPNLTVNYIIKH